MARWCCSFEIKPVALATAFAPLGSTAIACQGITPAGLAMKRPAKTVHAPKRTARTGRATPTPQVSGRMQSFRQQMSHVNVSPLFYHGKVRFALKLADLEKLTDKVKHWQVAQEEMKLGAGDQKKSPSNVAHVFWDQVELFKKHVPAEAEAHLTSIEQVGLKSGVQAGMDLHLWSYHRVVNAPFGVVLRQAADVLPLEEAKKCVEKNKHNLHKVADLVRLLAVQNYPGKTKSLQSGHLLRECQAEDFERNPVQRLSLCFRV